MNGQKIPPDDLKPGQTVLVRRWRPQAARWEIGPQLYATYEPAGQSSGKWERTWPCKVVAVLLPLVIIDSLKDQKRINVDLQEEPGNAIEFFQLTPEFSRQMLSGFEDKMDTPQPEWKGSFQSFGRIP